MTGAVRWSRMPGYLSLFASLGTVACCALPSLLVVLGLGATVASLLSAAPWLVTLSRQKGWMFLVSGLLVAANGYYVYRLAPRLLARAGGCAPGEEAACAAASRLSRAVLWVSVAIYASGFLVAFLLAPILEVLP